MDLEKVLAAAPQFRGYQYDFTVGIKFYGDPQDSEERCNQSAMHEND